MSKSQAGEAGSSKSFIRKGPLSLATKGGWSPNKGQCSACLYGRNLIRLKKIATLLPKNWLAETPQALAPRRLGRQSAERERISEIYWNVF
ncbi:hypothetical protein [Peribacillus frigoritolerans]|uniref:hypothetical protein n=1 Tax=Peribacillus frigoritolerans TaxID=450367 RepID=UPI0022819A4C|nr:hypothetical protein [Peribacillus frigoritolerans]MCY9005564.1 hypothetical protein [Peribacillus frigoritolerans]